MKLSSEVQEYIAKVMCGRCVRLSDKEVMVLTSANILEPIPAAKLKFVITHFSFDEMELGIYDDICYDDPIPFIHVELQCQPAYVRCVKDLSVGQLRKNLKNMMENYLGLQMRIHYGLRVLVRSASGKIISH